MSAPPWRSFRRGQERLKTACRWSEPRCPTPCQTPPALTEQCPTPVTPFAPPWPSWGPAPISYGYQHTEAISNKLCRAHRLVFLSLEASTRPWPTSTSSWAPTSATSCKRSVCVRSPPSSSSSSSTHTTICPSRVTHPSMTHQGSSKSKLGTSSQVRERVHVQSVTVCDCTNADLIFTSNLHTCDCSTTALPRKGETMSQLSLMHAPS